ncbi:hypothetical protein BsWGS_27737 [Bradybaena similaris]
MGAQNNRQTLHAPRSLDGLFMESISRSLNNAEEQYRTIAGAFDNVDWGNREKLLGAFSSVQCNDLCYVCFQFAGDQLAELCENHCQNTCHWDYGAGDESGQPKRSLVEACLGFPGGVRFNFGGIGDLLKSLPLIG